MIAPGPPPVPQIETDLSISAPQRDQQLDGPGRGEPIVVQGRLVKTQTFPLPKRSWGVPNISVRVSLFVGPRVQMISAAEVVTDQNGSG